MSGSPANAPGSACILPASETTAGGTPALPAMSMHNAQLGLLEVEGVQVFTMFATDRISAKVLVMFPHQTEPEHWHPPIGADPGKEETIRVIAGTLIFLVPESDTRREGWVPSGKDACYTSRHEIVMKPCDQLTLPPGTKHWFQARAGGAVFYSFSTCVRDGLDRFSDPAIVRQTVIVEDEPAEAVVP